MYIINVVAQTGLVLDNTVPFTNDLNDKKQNNLA